MTTDISNAITEVQDLPEALTLVVDASAGRQGILRIAEGALKATVYVDSGRIVGAEIWGRKGDPTEALKQILRLKTAAFGYLEGSFPSGSAKIDYDIRTLLANDLSLEPKAASQTDKPEASAAPPEAAVAGTDGSLTEEIRFDADGSLTEEIRFQNDDHPTEEVRFQSDEHLTEEIRFDADGSVTEEVRFHSDDHPTEEIRFDADGSVTEEVSFHSDDHPTEEIRFQSDDCLTEEVNVSGSPESNCLTEEIKFDLDSPVTEEIRFQSDDAMTEEVRFQAEEALTEEINLYRQQPRKTGSTDGADQRFDNLIQRWTEEENKSEFFEEIGSLQQQESGLTDEQRHLLAEMRHLADPVSFHKADPQLEGINEPGLGLTEQQIELMQKAEIDEKPFDTAEANLKELASEGLSEEKKALLELSAQISDAKTFQQSDGTLARQELVIPEEERWALEANANLQTPEQQKEEFQKSDPTLVEAGEAEFRDFVEPEKPAQPVLTPEESELLQAIPSAQDYEPLVKPAEDLPRPEREATEGIIGRETDVSGKLGTYTPERAERPDYGKYIGPSVLVLICVALFTVPSYLKSLAYNGKDDQLARQQMRLVVEEEMANEVPYASHDPTVSNDNGAHSQNTSAPANGFGEGATNTSTLSMARSYANQGRNDEAASAYERYLAEYPDSVTVRAELIQLYIKMGKKDRARQHAITGLKLNISLDQRNLLWSLFRQCAM